MDKDPNPNLRDRKNTKHLIEQLTDDRFLVKFKNKSTKFKKGKRKGMTTRDSTKIYNEDSEEESTSAFQKQSVKNESDKLLVASTSLKTSDMALHKYKITDDYSIIEDPRTDIKIKEITVYASHYIMAIEITYIECDLTETKTIHASNMKYLNERPDIEKCTLKLDHDEYIDFISYGFSSQKKFIRSLQIGTTGGHLMIIEGQIELNNMHAESGPDSTYSSILNNVGPDKAEARRSYPNTFRNQSEIQAEKDNNLRLSYSDQPKVSVVRKNFNSKSSRKMSLVKQGDKMQTLDMIKLKQRVVGLKTKFSEYLLGIELYTEPCTYHDL